MKKAQIALYLMGVLVIANGTAMLIAMGYYLFIDTKIPITMHYQHPKFLSEPVGRRPEFRDMGLDKVKGGETVYRYVEYCLDRDVRGEIVGVWSNGVPHIMLVTPTIGDQGCFKRNVPIEVPHVKKEEKMTYRQKIHYQVNPLKEVTFINDPISVVVVP